MEKVSIFHSQNLIILQTSCWRWRNKEVIPLNYEPLFSSAFRIPIKLIPSNNWIGPKERKERQEGGEKGNTQSSFNRHP